jgi:hypothetical protein
VTIVGYKQSTEKGKAVIFELQDDNGRKLNYRFPLSTAALQSGHLRDFKVAALNQRSEEHQGEELVVARAATYKALKGRRIAIYVDKNNAGYSYVVGFEAVTPAA